MTALKKEHELSRYVLRRLHLIDEKKQIEPTDEDIKFFNAMNLKQGTRGFLEYLRGFEENPKHQDPIMPKGIMYYKDMQTGLDNKLSKSSMYFTPNGFKTWSTAKNNLLTIKAIFLDIDFNKAEPTPLIERIQLVKMTLEDARLPYPTAFIDSGNGIHIYYILDEERYDNSEGKKIINLARILQENFVNRFNGSISNVTDRNDLFHADSQPTNPAHKMRMPATRNGRNEAHCVEFQKNAFTSLEYLFEENMPDYKPKKYKLPKKGSKPKNKRIVRLHNTNILNQSRIKDFKKLIELRHGQMKGHRNSFIYIAARQFIWHAKENWEADVYEMNRMFNSPLSQTVIKRTIESALRQEQWLPFSNKNIIRLLDITEHEMKHMSTISSLTAREKRENRRQQARDKKEARNLQICKMFNDGVSKAKIAREVGISRPTIYKVLEDKGFI